MKIQSSSITMASTHSYQSLSYVETATLEAQSSKNLEAAILELSKEAEGGRYTDAMKSYEKGQKEEAKKRQAENMQARLENQRVRSDLANPLEVSDQYKLKLELLRQMLAMLSKGQKLEGYQIKELKADGVLDLRRNPESFSIITHNEGEVPTIPLGKGSLWTKVTATSGFVSEYESTTFASQGMVQTSDGKSIDFNVSFSMSRACEMEMNSLEVSNYILTDPLVINLDTDMTSIGDQKFFFDLDGDGKEEEISGLGKGSAFLALDKNEDGIINDGNELFGTKSGDGFKDLGLYDEDGNHWIDENDSIFRKLKVWAKDEEGNDILLSLKEADVGAIYLENANTEYSFKDDKLQTNAVLRKTGVYLKESSGKVGTMSHVDLAV